MELGSGAACSAAGRAQTDSPVASSAAEHGVGGPCSGAALPSRREYGDETDEDSEGSEEESEDEIDTNSDGSTSDDGFPSKSGRVRQQTSNSNGAAGSADTSETAPGLRSLEPADGFSEPTTCLTAAAVQERAAAMFVVGTSAPQASGMSPAAKRATMELVMLAYNAANELCDTQGDALSKSFANFDRVVALGWLLGDAMGARLLLREQAYAVGLKARKAAVALKADVVAKKRAVQRKASKLKADDPQRRELSEKAEAEEAEKLRKEIEFPMMPAQPAPSGSRKRKRKTKMTQSERERLDDERVLKAEKAVKRAKALVERAGKAEEEAASRCTAAVDKCEKCEGPLKRRAALTRLSRLSMQQWGAAREFRLEAEIAELRAEVRRQDAALESAHNDMASSLKREGRLEVHCEELLASAKDDQKKMRSLIAFSKAHLNASE